MLFYRSPDARHHLFACLFLLCELLRVCLAVVVGTGVASALGAEPLFPSEHWDTQSPEALHVDKTLLIEVADLLGGRGCVVKDGFVVHAWGDQSERSDWMSSAKPVISTLLLFALQEGLIESVDQPVSDFNSRLTGKDRDITFRHLGSMTSGYRRLEPPGAAWAYNDPAIQLYQLALFDQVFQTDPHDVSIHPDRLGPLDFEEGLSWRRKNRRLRASVRDFARISWFWLNQGRWGDRQLLPAAYFDEYVRPQTPKGLPHTGTRETEDYLQIGSYGGGSDHFTKYGAGIYGFNWWFNGTGRLHSKSRTWPGAPPDTYLSIGAGGNCAAMFPSLNMVLVCAAGQWGKLEAGNVESRMNRILTVAAKAVDDDPNPPQISDSKLPLISGVLAKWRPVVLDFHGPVAHASDSDPNPFLSYRLQVRFTSPTGNSYDVPGFFAADGSGGLSGDVWRAVFSADEAGAWHYRASFRRGSEVAVSQDRNAGDATDFDGTEGRFEIGSQDASALGFYRWGRLEYAGGHYLKLRDGPYWLKGGTDSPEDFLAYEGFENTPKAKHRYANHVVDWREGDPDWSGGKGKGIIGALNYLAAQEVNSLYFLPMNIGGDGKNVYPYLGPIKGGGGAENDNLHFDLAKLEQWGVVFEHAQRNGIMLHFVLNEAEQSNKRELDDGQLGVERKLFYRELIGRFGHLPALQWNISEEYNLQHHLKPVLVKEFAQYIGDVDPYDHPITVHHAGRAKQAWLPFLGDPRFPVTSFQENKDVSALVENWRARSRKAGFPLVVGMDEFFPDKTNLQNVDRHRREYLWPVYLSGGQIEFILDELLKVDDFRNYELLWRYMAYAKTFMHHLPFWAMEPCDNLLRGESEYQGKHSVVSGQVFAKRGEIYAIYLPIATNPGMIDLSQISGSFRRRWFDPRRGSFVGAEDFVQAGQTVTLGPPPDNESLDWVVLLEKEAPSS